MSKNKLKILLFLVAGLNSASSFSQHKKAVYYNQVKISPFRLVDPVHSGIEFSYERRHNKNYAGQFSFTQFITNNFTKDYENYKGFRVSIEEKYYFPLYIRNPYLSLEAVFQKNSYNTIGLFEHDSTTTTRYFQYNDSITIRRKAVIINVRLGRQFMIGRIVADLSFGIGVRFRNVDHEQKLYPGDKLLPPRHPNINYEANREKKDAAFNVPLNLRVGYVF
jgi:hypothetical protein